jgi:Protein of unknown function (DUF2510)
MDNGPGWRSDPEDEAQERYWSGSAWTDRVRPAGKSRSLHLPEHVPELQRALAAATTDIDAVEDRLSAMFDRTDGAAPPARPSAASTRRPRADRDVYADADTDAVAEDSVSDDDVEPVRAEWAHPADEDGSDDETFAELNAALAAEEPDETDEAEAPKRGLFRRRP